MAYKIKSMLKQTSGTGLSANYYLEQELNKFTDGDLEVTNPSNEGKSIAKVTKKFTTPELIKAKDTARERDEKKQIREAGREAAKNAEVDFVKATPMGSDYFSLMAATAENIASRAGQKRKARKAAKEMKREILSEAKDTKPLERKKEDITGLKSNDTRVPKKATEVVPNDFSVGRFQAQKDNKIKEEPKNKMNTEFIEGITTFPQMLPNGYIIPRGEGDKKTENLDPKYYYKDGTPRRSVKTNPKTGKEYVQINLSPAARAIKDTFKSIGDESIGDESIGDNFVAPFSNEAIAARKAKLEQAKQEREQLQKERELELEKIKQIQGLPMMGDGFNKGMSRKNKYKK